MNKAQEEAILGIILGPMCALVCGGLCVGLIYMEEGSFVRRLIMFGLFMIYFGVFWMIPFNAIFKKFRRKKTKYIFDERDHLISKRGLLAGYVGLWLYLHSRPL